MNLIKDFDLFIFDLDGVIYIGNSVAISAKKVITKLRKKKKKLIFLTNNPNYSPDIYSDKLHKMGIKCDQNEFVTSSTATRYYLEKNFRDLNKKSAYIFGSRHFKNEIRKSNIKQLTKSNGNTADFVIFAGHKNFNYSEIKTASLAIRNGAKFIATNRDPFYPTDVGLEPATGALLSSIECASEKKAKITGKPEKNIFEFCLKKANHRNRKTTVIIGDNLETDIVGGSQFGIKTVLCLTGSTERKKLKKSKIKPDYTINNLSEFK